MLDCVHPTPHNIWGSFFRTLIRDCICIINIFRNNWKWHICSLSSPPWQTMCYKHSFFRSVNTWCLSFAFYFGHFPPWGGDNPMWPVPAWSHPFCQWCSNQLVPAHFDWIQSMSSSCQLSRPRLQRIHEILWSSGWIYLCMDILGRGFMVSIRVSMGVHDAKIVKNHIQYDSIYLTVQNR